MFPEAGGRYHYLKQAFGPLRGFLFGWTSLVAIQAGANAYVAMAFGEYLGVVLPFFSSTHAIVSVSAGAYSWQPNTAQLADVLALAVLSTVNYFGTKQGARVQGTLTAIKLLSVAGLIGEEATAALLGPTAGRLLAAAVLVSVFGCLSSAFIGSSRLGLPMSEDALAFRWMARTEAP